VQIGEFVENRASGGRYSFTLDEAARATSLSLVAARASLRRLKHKGRVAMAFRGFYVIVPPEYRRLGCLPPEQFVPQLMDHLGLSHYVGLLSAAELHGAAHQRPQVFQVMLPANRPELRCGAVRVQFVARRNTSEMPTTKYKTPRGYATISTPEVTAFDLVGYSRHCGGLGNVATILAELATTVKAKELARVAPLSPLPWAQRLGYLLDTVGVRSLAEPLAGYVTQTAREYVDLNPARRGVAGTRSARWRLRANEHLEPDL
jgi:predicted transcriptional regulator of viral defense system